jgi:hydroxymethylpyrimidine pyrophosphatase-like HAD family hydrolase
MRYVCLTCDYDGTLARNGKVAQSTIHGLEKVRASNRKLILATGRQLDDLLSVFPEVSLFDRVVAENGALLYRPASKEQILLGGAPPQPFVEELRRRGVEPLSVGRSVVATWHPHETTVLEVIRAMSLELQIIFNKNAVMVLPSGVNKSTGLSAALDELGISPHNAVGVGDAENDHAFLGLCECGVAVSNALPALKDRADWVTAHSHGGGVEEVVQLLLQNDLEDLAPRLKRHDILLGTTDTEKPFSFPGYGTRVLIAGPSGSGKSTTVSAIVERLLTRGYQVCLLDPEGDYDEFEHLMTLGGPERIPSSSEILETLGNPRNSLSINLLGVPLADRPAFFQALLARIQELRFKTGHPHWVVVDEAHHMLPAELGGTEATMPKELGSFVLVTVHPDRVSPAVLKVVNGIIAVGPDPQAVISGFKKRARSGLRLPALLPHPRQTGEVVAWLQANPAVARLVRVEPAKGERRRHQRKYASGELGADRSFYFRGANGKLNLRAQNMNLFAQMAEGVDEDTWSFHLTHGDYSRWLRETIKDAEIAELVATLEEDRTLSPRESRRQILDAIRKHYTAPA